MNRQRPKSEPALIFVHQTAVRTYMQRRLLIHHLPTFSWREKSPIRFKPMNVRNRFGRAAAVPRNVTCLGKSAYLKRRPTPRVCCLLGWSALLPSLALVTMRTRRGSEARRRGGGETLFCRTETGVAGKNTVDYGRCGICLLSV